MNKPSFSSSLLDEMYRSIDEQELMVYRKTSCFENDQLQDIAKWMDLDKEKVGVRRRSDFKNSWQQRTRDYSSSSSCDSCSCGGDFSSSEAESASSRPKPISIPREKQYEDLQTKPKHQGKFVKTKSRAMKIYGDLKHPISPGGRLATFLNSLFFTNANNNTKLASSSSSSALGYAYAYDDTQSTLGYAYAYAYDDTQSTLGYAYAYDDTQSKSTSSSASSFSRSCLSKTPSSRGKLSNNKMTSVRFFPVDQHKSLYGQESNLQSLKNTHTKIHSSDENRRIEEAARNLLRNYQKKVECEFDLITNKVKSQKEININYEEEEEEDDDDASHTSSDLFELENFSAIGMDKYRDELPVYETTHLEDTNLAIGNGFLM